MNAFQVMDRYRKEVIQVSTLKNGIKVQYLNDTVDYSDPFSDNSFWIN